MASHSLAISRASLTASMLRPDPMLVPRAEVARFLLSLDAMLEHCSPTNIQLCKDWLWQNILDSPNRINAIGKYLVALSGSFNQRSDSRAPSKRGPPSQRKQMHVLYLLNDTLHHAKHHVKSAAVYRTLAERLQPHALGVIKFLSTQKPKEHAQHYHQILDLLELWAQAGYFQDSYIQIMRNVVSEAKLNGHEGIGEPKAPADLADSLVSQDRENVPYIMPTSHGDSSTPFYDLPAGNMIPHIIPNSTAPIDSQLVKPLRFAAGPADQALIRALKILLEEVNDLDGMHFDEKQLQGIDFDEMGQHSTRDLFSRKIKRAGGYYGWSQEFCQKMKMGGSPQVFGKTSRYMNSEEVSHDSRTFSDSRSTSDRSRSRLSSRSKSPSNEQYRGLRSVSRSYSPPSPPPVLTQSAALLQTPSGSRSRSPPYDPRRLPPPQTGNTQSLPWPPPFPRFTFGQGTPLGPTGISVPPRPPNYHGSWPPPPPQPLPGPRASQPISPPVVSIKNSWVPATSRFAEDAQPSHDLGQNGSDRGYGCGASDR